MQFVVFQKKKLSSFLKPFWYHLSIAIGWSVELWSCEDIGLEILLILQWIFACLSKTAIKKTKQNVKFVQTFFISHVAALRPTMGHWQGGSLTHSMLISALFQVRPEVHREPRNNVGSHSITECIQWDLSQKPSFSECNVLSHCVTHPKNVPETIDHLVASFFSRNYKSFSLILNIFHTLSQCYYSNFKHVNVDREVLR